MPEKEEMIKAPWDDESPSPELEACSSKNLYTSEEYFQLYTIIDRWISVSQKNAVPEWSSY